MSAPDPPPEPPPPPPLAHRAESDAEEFDHAASERHWKRVADAKSRRTLLIVILLATLLPFAACGFTLLACAVSGFQLH